jgi:hypothetical protein
MQMCRIREGIHSFIDESQGLFDYSQKNRSGTPQAMKKPLYRRRYDAYGLSDKGIRWVRKSIFLHHDGFT